MEQSKNLFVYLQILGENLHPVSRKIATTARVISQEGNLVATGIVFCKELNDGLRRALTGTHLDSVIVFTDSTCEFFIPEIQVNAICSRIDGNSEIFLVPATPEGRCISSMVGARLHTGVTADCTSLYVGDNGLLVQTRPAFSGNMLARIVTECSRPQIASLRFASKVADTQKVPNIEQIAMRNPLPVPSVEWVDTPNSDENIPHDLVIAIGGGLREKNDIELFCQLSNQYGAMLCCSRALVDRGWMPKSYQIGLSGSCVSAKNMITFGISGSVQFQAGLEKIGHLIAVNLDDQASIMRIADMPIQGDIYEIAGAMLKK